MKKRSSIVLNSNPAFSSSPIIYQSKDRHIYISLIFSLVRRIISASSTSRQDYRPGSISDFLKLLCLRIKILFLCFTFYVLKNSNKENQTQKSYVYIGVWIRAGKQNLQYYIYHRKYIEQESHIL